MRFIDADGYPTTITPTPTFLNPTLEVETKSIRDTEWSSEIPVTVSDEQFEAELCESGGLEAIAIGETKWLPCGATVTVTKRISYGNQEVQS
jgi:hypothetical protein